MSSVPALIATLLATIVATAGVILAVFTPHPRPRTESERYFTHVLTGEKIEFSLITDNSPSSSANNSNNNSDSERKRRTSSRLSKGKDQDDDGLGTTVDLTVVVPAYNETARLPIMLAETLDFLEARKQKDHKLTFEVLIVDDGSKDGTSKLARDIAKERKCPHVRVLTLELNRGKGGAVTQGMMVARGEKLLFADADGATRFADVEFLEYELSKVVKDGHGVAVGSRAHMVKSDAVVKRSAIRNFLMHGFHTFLLILGISSIKDTQCGFKLVTRKTAATIFPHMHVEGWIFDIEMLLLATWYKIPLVEVPVTWHEVDGSKVNILKDSIRMAIDLLMIRFYYFTGLWSAFGDNSKEGINE
ncbi:UNVERIFIED_CONTAM: dolichyl-phosphate beta-glucosyltransferase [Siphonaria sp. JEL0065]|nr:dolichyl-phosphate beta-glucosyltransferase [Siphonaria sp. JEL0065]